RVHDVPSHGGRECLEIVSHVNRIHSTDSLLLPPSVTTLALAAENPASAGSDVAARADIRRHSLQMASDGTPPRHRECRMSPRLQRLGARPVGGRLRAW